MLHNIASQFGKYRTESQKSHLSNVPIFNVHVQPCKSHGKMFLGLLGGFQEENVGFSENSCVRTCNLGKQNRAAKYMKYLRCATSKGVFPLSTFVRYKKSGLYSC